MPRPIQTFEGEGFRFVDFQNAPSRAIHDARAILWRVLKSEILDVLRPGVDLCRPALDESGNNLDPGCDATLEVINFVMRRTRDGELAGVLNLYNVQRIAGEGWRAAVMPGFRATDRWGDVMSFILENDLMREGGQRLNFVRWDHPDIEGQRWAGDPIADASIDRMIARGHRVRRRNDGSPIDTRKRLA